MDYEEEKIKVPRFNEQGGFYTTEKRSKLMGKIGGRDTKPELRLRKALWNKGVRYRVHNTQLPGKPDISIKKYKLAVFIDGEFWHGYNWPERKHDLKSNRGFWIPKIERNMQRDREINRQLEAMGFTVFRFWEKEVKRDLRKCVNDILVYIDTHDSTIL